MGGAEFAAAAEKEISVHDLETGSLSDVPVDVLLLPIGPLAGDFAAGTRPRIPFGTRFVFYQRNIENLCKDQATLGEEIRKSVAELLDAAHYFGAKIAIKAPQSNTPRRQTSQRTSTARPRGYRRDALAAAFMFVFLLPKHAREEEGQ